MCGARAPQNLQSEEGRRYLEASPVNHVSPDDPPILLLHGDADETVPFEQAELMSDALRVATTLEKELKEGHATWLVVAFVYAALEDNEKTLHALEQGFEEREPLMFALKVYPRWDGLRDDPRFQELVRRMNFPED